MGINVGGAFLFREIARGLIKFIPVAGSFLSAGVAFGSTYAIGEAAIAYFISRVSKDKAN